MEQHIKIQKRRFLSIFVIIFGIVALNACRVTLIPSFDANISQQIESTAKAIDKFYLLMLGTSKAENGGRAFSKFSEQYVDVEVELNSLLNKKPMKGVIISS